ncbi:MAG: penicillin-binding protein 2 [Kiritimatiellae bacterium]|nr:penicillin-binding protein 2 [Kiritimatiellia bacterium]
MSQRSKLQKKWIIWLVVIIVMVYMVIMIDLYRTQLGFNNKSKNYSRKPQTFSNTVYAVRGNIFDRNLENPTVLATSTPQWKVFLDPSMINTNDAVLFEALASWNELPVENINKGLKKDRSSKYVVLGQTTNRDFVEHLRTNSITRKCVGFESSFVRKYPMGNFLNPVLGIVNSHGESIMGLEYEYNRHLVGTNGFIEGVTDAKRKELRLLRTKEVKPTNGNDIYLTISTFIQKTAEDILVRTMATNNAERGWIVVQRPYTGEILAMASYPTFTRENYGNEDEELRRNNVTSFNFEPGSIMKAMIFSLGLEELHCTTNQVFDCRDRLFFGRRLSDHVKDEETFASALAKSSNRASSIIAMTTTKKRMEEYIKAYGFCEKTGIIRIGEEKGILSPHKKWSDLQFIRIAIGQGISVTPIQMIGMYSTIANGGVRMKPYLIREIHSPTGEVILKNEPKRIGRVISNENAKIMAQLLVGVTDRSIGGTGHRARIPGYSVAGKTGTAQKSINGGYSETDYTGSFVGFFPAENPEVTILVGFDNPKPKYQGSTVAAPVFSELGKAIADYLNIPTNTDNVHNIYNYIDMNK